MTLDLGDLPTWLASIGTVAATSVALWQVAGERHHRRDAEDRDRQERHRGQARLISSMPGPSWASDGSQDPADTTTIDCLNTSSEPVYNVVVSVVFLQGAGPGTTEEMLRLTLDNASAGGAPVTTLSLLPPGTWRAYVPGQGWTSVLAGRPGTEIAFSDQAGAHWIRRASGALVEIDTDPLTYFGTFGLAGPYEFQTPQPIT